MKTIPTLAALLLSILPLLAHEGQGHDKVAAGPNGGRILTTVEPHAEFFVTRERKIQITFLGEDGKPIPPAGQVIAVTTGERSAPVKITFTKTTTGFLSEQVIPEGNNLPVVVQIKPAPEEKASVAKFTLNLSVCPGCQLAEYACTCAH
jgi:hypothetical protein